MLYLLIPCLVLLVVAVVLKKRKSNKSNSTYGSDEKTITDKTKKSTIKRDQRLLSSSSQVDIVSPVSLKAAAIDPEKLIQIQQLIKTEHYDVAEAKINQFLNKNNRQDELYLYLLDIHVAQNDHVAIKKLISHLRSLDLHVIADQAEVKQKMTAAQNVAAAQIIEQAFKTAKSKASLAQNNPLKSAIAFDSLIHHSSGHDLLINDLTRPISHAFDSLKANNRGSLDDENDLPPIEYSVDHIESNRAEIIEKQNLKQNIDSKPTQIETSSTALNTASESVPNKALEPTEKQTTLLQLDPFELTLSAAVMLDEHRENSCITDKTITSTAFVALEPVLNQLKAEEHSSLEFKLEGNLATTTEQTNAVELNVDASLSADLNSGPVENKNIDLNATEIGFTTDLDAIQNATQHTHDPLVQKFPELLHIKEIELNLDLASRYIELGAYAAAKKLLAAESENYSIEQRERSEKLLNQIAYSSYSA